ncbi:MAG: amidohydrolase family protein [Planctomycetota bacterium]|nr:amidohydrolase family protein [Planctomycetota bacterium]
MIDNTLATIDGAIRSRWIWTGQGQPIRDGVIRVEGDRIASVSEWKDFNGNASEVHDLGDCCLLPGFINAHTHLEFSDLTTPIAAGKNFAEWILRVVQHRMLSSIIPGVPAKQAALDRHHQGAQEAIRGGTALALNVVHGALSNAVDGLYEIPFAELMDTTDLRCQQTWRSARSMMRECVDRDKLNENRSESANENLGMGLSPHAPYTTTGRLVCRTVERCRRFHLPLMMHLAETREEIEWIEKGSGPLQEMLEMMVGPIGNSTADRLPMIGYVNEIVQAPKTLLIHGNYLDHDSRLALAKHRETAAVVFCPRTHQHFRHEPYPLEQMREQGVRVLLGTDSRASNPDLSILEEARKVSQEFSSIRPEQILRMITADAAEFLGLERSFGFLRPDSIGIINSVPCSSLSAETVLEEVLNSQTKPVLFGKS